MPCYVSGGNVCVSIIVAKRQPSSWLPFEYLVRDNLSIDIQQWVDGDAIAADFEVEVWACGATGATN